jgi:hypothetical protein
MNPIMRIALFICFFFASTEMVWAERPSPGEGRTGLMIFGVLVVVMMGVAVAMSLIRKEDRYDDEEEEEEENEKDEDEKD